MPNRETNMSTPDNCVWHKEALNIRHPSGARILIGPNGVASAEIEAMAWSFCDAETQRQTDADVIASLRRTVAEQAEKLRRADAMLSDARRQLDRALTGRAGFSRGPFAIEPHTDGDWTGEVWLMDPVKLGSGTGFRYASLADLWRAWPELRPIRTESGRIIVAPFEVRE